MASCAFFDNRYGAPVIYAKGFKSNFRYRLPRGCDIAFCRLHRLRGRPLEMAGKDTVRAGAAVAQPPGCRRVSGADARLR